jgi:hypothetical protein
MLIDNNPVGLRKCYKEALLDASEEGGLEENVEKTKWVLYMLAGLSSRAV